MTLIAIPKSSSMPAEKAREFNVRFGGDTYVPRNFPDMGVCWTAPHTKYYPLYFEDPALERYGHTHHNLIQPIISSARMSGQTGDDAVSVGDGPAMGTALAVGLVPTGRRGTETTLSVPMEHQRQHSSKRPPSPDLFT